MLMSVSDSIAGWQSHIFYLQSLGDRNTLQLPSFCNGRRRHEPDLRLDSTLFPAPSNKKSADVSTPQSVRYWHTMAGRLVSYASLFPQL